MTDNEKKLGIRKAFELKAKVSDFFDNNRLRHLQVFPVVDVDKEWFGIKISFLDSDRYWERVTDVMAREFSDELEFDSRKTTIAFYRFKGV